MSGTKLHSEISRKGGQSRSLIKMQAARENLLKAKAALAAKRAGLNASQSTTGSKPFVSTRHQSSEPAKVEGGQSPIVGLRYVNRNGVYLLAERAAPGELVFRFDGQNFCVCGRLRDK
jgi:hypothetical protein